MAETRTIKDSVHDHIEVGGAAAALLDTPAVQRLRRVRQLGTVPLVYPSANHTRFEHSLGVYHLATRALDSLGIGGRAADRVAAAALLHDVGHGPFSHTLEPLVHRHTDHYHDEVGGLLADGAVGDILRDRGLDPGRIARLIRGEGRYGGLISGELDVDRMDYLVRDAHHTGVPYGTIDHDRLIRALRFVDGGLVLAAGNVQTAESLLLARALMNPTVYRHHTARIAKAMLRRAAERLLTAGATTARRLRRMDDYDFLTALRSAEETAGVARRYDSRDLYTRAVWAERRDVPDRLIAADHAGIRETERAIADRAGVDRDAVILDAPPEPSMTESDSRVLVGGEVRRLDRESPLVSALRTAGRRQWRLGVYAPPDATEAVGRAAVAELGLDLSGDRISRVHSGVHATLDEFE
jgi:HD superfamily phosphohydrolase